MSQKSEKQEQEVREAKRVLADAHILDTCDRDTDGDGDCSRYCLCKSIREIRGW